MQKPFVEPAKHPIRWILLCTIIVYSTAIYNGFVWLDHTELVQGQYRVGSISEWADLWTSSLDEFTLRDETTDYIADFDGGGYWRPLHALSLTASWLLWRGLAPAYHLENVLLHLLIVVLLFKLGCKLLPDSSRGKAAAFWGTLWFAVHPLGVHSVTWISGRKDLLCVVFALLALHALDRTGHSTQIPAKRTRSNPKRRKEVNRSRNLLWLIAGSLCTLFACASKESGAVIPLLACLVLLPDKRLSPRTPKGFRNARYVALAAAATVSTLYIGYRIMVLGGIGLGGAQRNHSLVQQIALSSRVFIDYLLRILVPRIPNPSDAWIFPDPASWQTLLLLAVIPAIILLWVSLYRKRTPIWKVIAWFLIWLIPVSGLIPLTHVRAERYLYPASWGLLTAAAYCLIQILPTRVQSFILCTLSLVPAALLMYANTEWQSDKTLFSNAVRRDPLFVEGHIALGNLDLNEHQYEQALEHYEAALEIVMRDDVAAYYAPFILHSNAGSALYRLGRYSEATAQFILAYRIRPESRTARHHLGLAAMALGDVDLSVQIFRNAVSDRPDDNLLRGNLGFAYLQQGNFNAAIEVLTPLVEQRKNDPILLMNLASAHLARREFPAAAPYLEDLTLLTPSNALAQAKYAWALWETGEINLARYHLEKALTLDAKDQAVDFVKNLILKPNQGDASEAEHKSNLNITD